MHRTGDEFIAENVNAVTQYADYVTGGEVDTAANVPKCAGAVMRRGMKKVVGGAARPGFCVR